MNSIDRLETAMRAMQAVNAGPMPMDLLRRTTRPSSAWSTIPLRAAVATGVAATIAVGLHLSLRSTPAFALAEVVNVVGNAHTLSLSNIDQPDMQTRIKGTRVRTDTDFKEPTGEGPQDQPRQVTMLVDTETGETLAINHTARTVLRVIHNPRRIDFIRQLREIAERPTKPLGKREVEGIVTQGFAGEVHNEVTGKDFPVRVWIDPATRRPVRMEYMDEAKPDVVTGGYEKFVFDAPLDDALFDMTPPAGYAFRDVGGVTLQHLKPAATTREAAALVATPGVGLGGAMFGMSMAEVVAILGEPESPGANSGFYEYPSRGFTLVFSEGEGLVGINLNSNALNSHFDNLRDFPGETDKHIRIGSTAAEVIAAYGKPDVEEPFRGLSRLAFHASRLDVYLKDGKVALLYLNAP